MTKSLFTNDIKLLTVGNSFANDATRFLKEIIEADGNCKLLLGKANIGGCPLDEHVRMFKEAEVDPSQKHYSYDGKDGRRMYNLKEALQDRKWDIVTLQQVSHKSPDFDTFYPYIRELYDYVKKYAPQAEIVIHQTWAYRSDHDHFKHSDEYNQQIMYERLTKNYCQIAKDFGCRILPSGTAMQTVREKQPVKFSFPDPNYNYETPRYPKLPNQAGSLNVGYKWNKDEETGDFKLSYDGIHANERGQFLQGLVWHEILLGKDARANSFKPDSISAEDAKFLCSVAHEVASSFPQEI